MSKTVTIPTDGMNPFVVMHNGEKYVYTPGATVEVPDGVALEIEEYKRWHEKYYGENESPFKSPIDDITAEVGQAIVVKSVDENGKPTEWAAADFGGALQLVGEQEITTADGVSVIEFDGLDNYQEAIMVVYAYYNNTGSCTAVMKINDKQVEKDFYNFQHASIDKINTFRIKKIQDGVYSTEVIHNDSVIGGRYLGGFALNGTWANGTIEKIAFHLSTPLTSCSSGVPSLVKFYAR